MAVSDCLSVIYETRESGRLSVRLGIYIHVTMGFRYPRFIPQYLGPSAGENETPDVKVAPALCEAEMS